MRTVTARRPDVGWIGWELVYFGGYAKFVGWLMSDSENTMNDDFTCYLRFLTLEHVK